MKLNKALIVLTLGFTVASSAQAGLVGVKSIEIKNAINAYLQVAEVNAFNTSNFDVASTDNAVASAPDSWGSSTLPAKAIDGITAGSYSAGQIFHEGGDNSHDTLTITLNTATELNFFQIYGRTDCCSNRDVYDITFKNATGDTLYFIDNLSAFNKNQSASVDLANINQQVPEPVSLALLGLGLVGLAASRRKSSK